MSAVFSIIISLSSIFFAFICFDKLDCGDTCGPEGMVLPIISIPSTGYFFYNFYNYAFVSDEPFWAVFYLLVGLLEIFCSIDGVCAFVDIIYYYYDYEEYAEHMNLRNVMKYYKVFPDKFYSDGLLLYYKVSDSKSIRIKMNIFYAAFFVVWVHFYSKKNVTVDNSEIMADILSNLNKKQKELEEERNHQKQIVLDSLNKMQSSLGVDINEESFDDVFERLMNGDKNE